MNKLLVCLVVLLSLLAGQPCHAAKLKAYVARFAVSVPDSREDLKGALQTLLMSRLNNEAIQAVETQGEADVVVVGSYIVFGTVFSLDALVKTGAGVFIDRVFVQGDAQSELIPAVSDMARRIHRSLASWNPNLTITPIDTPAVADRPVPPPPRPIASQAATPRPAPKQASPPSTPVEEILPKTAPAPPPPVAALVTAPEPDPPQTVGQPWTSQRLPETFTGIAVGRTRTGGGKELFVTGEHYLGYYLKDGKLQFLSEVVFEANERVVGIDVADLDRDGIQEIYVSIIRDGVAASQVFIPEKNVLRKVGTTLPYLLRALALDGREKKIYAQTMTAGQFRGDVGELAKGGEQFSVAAPLRLPPLANLFNFNRFTDAKGESFFVVSHPDGYLLVYSKERKQLWKSRDKFGGKETAACTPAGKPGALACAPPLPQRLLVTRNGGIVVARNAGPAANGDARTYGKHSVVRLAWNGSSLKEEWRSEQSPFYLADFGFDERSRELLLLEVEPKEEAAAERGSRVEVKLMP